MHATRPTARRIMSILLWITALVALGAVAGAPIYMGM